MAPLRDYDCLNCEASMTDVIVNLTDTPTCEKCGSDQLQVRMSFIGNYTIKGNNSASVRPKRMGGSK